MRPLTSRGIVVWRFEVRRRKNTRALCRLTIVTLALATLIGAAFAAGPMTIHGMVVNEKGEPLAGVSITATAQAAGTEPITIATTTKKKGNFKLQVPDWDQTYTITANLEGHASGETTFHPNPREQGTLSFTLPVEEAPTAVEDTTAPTAEVDQHISPEDSRRMAAIPIFNEGVDAIQANDHDTAIAKFQEAAALDPEFSEAYRGIAASALELKDYQTAADAAEKILEMDPDNEEALGTAYFAELMSGDVDRMVISAERLARVNPALVSSEMLNHALVLYDQNATEQSRALLEVIVGLQPEFAAAQFQLGLACNTLGDAQCAQEALGAFLEIEPDSPDAQTARSLLEYVN